MRVSSDSAQGSSAPACSAALMRSTLASHSSKSEATPESCQPSRRSASRATRPADSAPVKGSPEATKRPRAYVIRNGSYHSMSRRRVPVVARGELRADALERQLEHVVCVAVAQRPVPEEQSQVDRRVEHLDDEIHVDALADLARLDA